MAAFTYEKETETIRRQNETECEDKIRLKVLTEHIGFFIPGYVTRNSGHGKNGMLRSQSWTH